MLVLGMGAGARSDPSPAYHVTVTYVSLPLPRMLVRGRPEAETTHSSRREDCNRQGGQRAIRQS